MFKKTSERAILVFVFIAFIAWWRVHEDKIEKQKANETKRQQVLGNATAKVKEFNTPYGQMLVMDLPVQSPISPDIVETKRCYVWRDFIDKAASLSCENTAMPYLD